MLSLVYIFILAEILHLSMFPLRFVHLLVLGGGGHCRYPSALEVVQCLSVPLHSSGSLPASGHTQQVQTVQHLTAKRSQICSPETVGDLNGA